MDLYSDEWVRETLEELNKRYPRKTAQIMRPQTARHAAMSQELLRLQRLTKLLAHDNARLRRRLEEKPRPKPKRPGRRQRSSPMTDQEMVYLYAIEGLSLGEISALAAVSHARVQQVVKAYAGNHSFNDENRASRMKWREG